MYHMKVFEKFQVWWPFWKWRLQKSVQILVMSTQVFFAYLRPCVTFCAGFMSKTWLFYGAFVPGQDYLCTCTSVVLFYAWLKLFRFSKCGLRTPGPLWLRACCVQRPPKTVVKQYYSPRHYPQWVCNANCTADFCWNCDTPSLYTVTTYGRILWRQPQAELCVFCQYTNGFQSPMTWCIAVSLRRSH